MSKRKASSLFSRHVHSLASEIVSTSSAGTRNRAVQDSTSDEHNELQDENQDNQLLILPDNALFHILSFTAAPTHRAGVICHQLARLCRASHTRFYQNTVLWEAILHEDYGASQTNQNNQHTQKRRVCRRLERSPMERVKEAHGLVKDNSEIAFYYLSELVNAQSGTLTRHKLCRLLDEYGPHLRINQRTSSGGVFLVEVCRARKVKEAVILKCVQELVETTYHHHGAMVDQQSYESASTYQTALCVAAVRGMPTIVQYLLEKGASLDILCSGRFRLMTNSKKTIRCNNQTALEFAKEAKRAELEHGAAPGDLKDLNKCIALLEQAV